MLRHHLTVAFRNLLRQRVYSAINISGLGLAIACCLLIFLFVQYEWTHDGFHENADRIYLVYQEDNQHGFSNPVRYNTFLSSDVAQAVREQYPTIDRTVRTEITAKVVARGETSFKGAMLFADPSIFDVFSFALGRGDPAPMFSSRNTVVLSQKAAQQYFGQSDPLGETITIEFKDGPREFVVAAVLEKIPDNSSIQFDLLLPYELGSSKSRKANLYVLLRDGEVGASALEAQFPALIEELMGREEAELKLRLQALTDLHFGKSIVGATRSGRQGNPAHPFVLVGIGVLVLAVACINFMNLAIGQASTRTREIGVRKVVGALRRQLMLQFGSEAVLMSLMALGLGLGLAELLLPAFNGLVQRELAFDYSGAPTWFSALGLALLIGLLAGSYPAAVLSGFKPAVAIRSTMKVGGKNWFGRGLIVLQFGLSIFLVIGAIVMDRQLEYLQIKDLGFDGEQVVSISAGFGGTESSASILERYKNELEPYGNHVGNLSVGFPAPGMGGAPLRWKFQGDDIMGNRFVGDYQFLETLGVGLVAGRNFSRDFAADADDAIIVNQTLANVLGWADPVGRELQGFAKEERGDPVIVGVMEDFHYKSLHQEIEPAVLELIDPQVNGFVGFVSLFARLDPDDIPGGMKVLEETWTRVAGDRAFNHKFLDEAFDAMYREEERWRRIVGYASGLATLIACMGLFGLVALAVGRRTKEIGVRKVLGASVGSVVTLLSREFTWLVLLANLIACPAAYYAADRWLQDFAYRAELGAELFALGGVLALSVAWATLSYQAVKAALTNPVDALRHE